MTGTNPGAQKYDSGRGSSAESTDLVPAESSAEPNNSNPQRGPRLTRRIAASLANPVVRPLAAIAFLGIGALALKDQIGNIIDGVIPDASHSAEVELGAPETVISENVYLNLGSVESEFPLRVWTSLRRPGLLPDCTLEIANTGEDGKNPKIETTSNFGVTFDQLKINPDEDTKTIAVSAGGGFKLTDPAVKYDDTGLEIQPGGMNVCVGSNEITSAQNIAFTAAAEGGRMALACALGSDEGQQVAEAALREYIRTSGLYTQYKTVTVIWEDSYRVAVLDLTESTETGLKEKISDKVNEYLNQTPDHADPAVNVEGITDCNNHDISIDRT